MKLKTIFTAVACSALLTALLGGGALWLIRAAMAASPGHDRIVFSEPLPNAPGKSLTAVVVRYPPGGRSPVHRHAGSVLAYVLTGAIRSENSATGPVRVYHVGETFFEPPGSTHLVCENASKHEPASLLAVFVANTGAVLTRAAGSGRGQ